MKTFRIGIWEEQGGYITTKAESKEQAVKIVLEKLGNDGINAFTDFDTTHRDTNITEIEELTANL